MKRPNRIFVAMLALALAAGACGTGAEPSETSELVPATVATTEAQSEQKAATASPVIEIAYPEESSLVETAQWGEVPADLVNVLVTEGSGREVAESLAEAMHGEVVGAIEIISYFQVAIEARTESELSAALEMAAAHEDVEAAFPELPLVAATESSCSAQGPLRDPWFADAASPANGKPFEAVGLEQAWAAVRAGGVKLSPVKVGVVDTGLYTGSAEISGSVHIAGARPGDSTNQPARGSTGALSFGGLNHGTGVAHVIGADPSNGGMVGVASILGENLSISVTDVFSGTAWRRPTAGSSQLTQANLSDGAWVSTTLAAILLQIDQGATVINLSLGAKNPGTAYHPVSDAYRRLLESVAKSHPKVVFVAAAGNDSIGIDGRNQAPGGLPLPNLITVGAVTADGNAAGFTNYAVEGGEVTISAPGVGVPMGIGSDGKPYHANGTSFSAPMVAGAAALLQSLNPELTAAQIKETLTATAAEKVEGATPVTIPGNLGGGILRVDQAALRVVNEMRARADTPKPSLTWDQVEALSDLTATASFEESDTYTVTGTVGSVEDEGTDLVLALLSDGTVAGDTSQTLTAPGSALWLVVLDNRSGTAAVNRTDTGVGCNLTLEPPSVDGPWTGAMVMGSIEVLSDQLMLDVGDDEPLLMTREECEALFASAAEDPIPIEYTFASTSPGAGSVSGITGGSDGGETASGSWISTGELITFEMGSDGTTITFEGTVADTVIEGTWDSSTEDLVIKGTFSMARAGGG